MVMAIFYSEIYHFHKPGSPMNIGFGCILKVNHSRLLSFCTQGFGPELQNPIVFKPYQSFSPRKKEFGRTDEGFGNSGFVKLLHTFCDYSRSPNRRGEFSLILDSATSPFGFAQNDKGGS